MLTQRCAKMIATVVGVAVLGIAGQALGAVKNWTGTAGAYWNVGSNWGGTAPINGDSLRFNPASSSQLSTINNISGLSVISARLGDPLTGNGGFNITGNSISVSYNSGQGYSFSNYGNNTWGLDTTATADIKVLNNTANTTLSFSGLVTNGGQTWTFDGPGNVSFLQVVSGGTAQGNGDLYKYGLGTVTLAPDPNQTTVPGFGRVDNFKSFYIYGGEVVLGNWIGWWGANNVNKITIGGTAMVTATGTMVMPNSNPIWSAGPALSIGGGGTAGTGTLRLRSTTSSRSNADLASMFFRGDTCGGAIESNVDLGDKVLNAPMRYVTQWAQGYPRSTSQGYGDAQGYEELTFKGRLSARPG